MRTGTYSWICYENVWQTPNKTFILSGSGITIILYLPSESYLCSRKNVFVISSVVLSSSKASAHNISNQVTTLADSLRTTNPIIRSSDPLFSSSCPLFCIKLAKAIKHLFLIPIIVVHLPVAKLFYKTLYLCFIYPIFYILRLSCSGGSEHWSYYFFLKLEHVLPYYVIYQSIGPTDLLTGFSRFMDFTKSPVLLYIRLAFSLHPSTYLMYFTSQECLIHPHDSGCRISAID